VLLLNEEENRREKKPIILIMGKNNESRKEPFQWFYPEIHTSSSPTPHNLGIDFPICKKVW